MDISQPITNPKLLCAIQELRTDSTNEEKFFQELFAAKFLCPIQMDLKNSSQKNNKITLGEGTTIVLKGIENQQREMFLMAFTDWEEVRKWTSEENPQMLVLTYADYQAIILKGDSIYKGFVINPYGDNLVINKAVLKNVYPHERKIQAGESVMIGTPKDYPIDMVEKLKEFFENAAYIKSAYLLWMARNQEMSYLLVLDIEGDEKEVFPVVGEICQHYLKGKMLDMVPLRSKFGQKAIEGQVPFYQK